MSTGFLQSTGLPLGMTFFSCRLPCAETTDENIKSRRIGRTIDLRILSEINITHNSNKLIEIATNVHVYYTLNITDSVYEMTVVS